MLDFAPILSYDALPLNDLVLRLLELTKEALKEDVEIEFAVEIDPLGRSKPRFGFLQARPMMVSRKKTTVTEGGDGRSAGRWWRRATCWATGSATTSATSSI